jgi:response regulator of citrate/malate metabolism
VLEAVRASEKSMSAALATTGDVTVGLRYGTTGRPEQEFVATDKRPTRPPR